ncbi:MAG: hypothetical protein ACLFV2_07065 [Desulfurivibrionaceae bacterium]
MNNDTDVNTLTAAANWRASDKLSLNFGLAYSMAEQKMEDVFFESDSFTSEGGDNDVTGLPLWYGEYDPDNTNDMESYSDLEYDVWDINLGASYAISDNIGLNLNYVFSDIDDEAGGYVYGDESGNYQSLKTYVTFRY